LEGGTSVKCPIYEYSGAKNDKTIQKKDAPIRQCPLGKIPFEKIKSTSHNYTPLIYE
jgi:hypothetical protein